MKAPDYNQLAVFVRRAQAGDSNAFAELYVATYQQQYRYAYKYLKDEHLAQDALQETFIQALRNIRTLQNPRLFVAWLNRINFRICYDMTKKLHMDQVDHQYQGDEIQNLSDEKAGPDEEVVEVDSQKYIMSQVMNLPLTESQVILMKYYQNMTLDEISDALSISRSTVKRSLKSGKERLGRSLSEFRA